MGEGRGNGAGAVMLLEEDAAKALVRQGQEAGFLTQDEIAALEMPYAPHPVAGF